MAYRVNIKLPSEMCPFRLPRKVATWVRPTKYPVGRIIKSIEYSHEEDSVCIAVDASDQLYVTRNFIVTHKTAVAIMAAEHLLETGQLDRVLIVVPAGLKYQWAEAIAKFTDLPTQTKRFKGESITIPDSRYCMVVDGPPDRRKRQYKQARETVTCNYVIIGLDNVESDTRDVRRLHAEFVILDEASAIKTMSAARTLAIKEHLGDVPWRMALTATPIDNRPDELFSIMEWVDASVLGRGDLFDLAYIERNVYGDPTGYKNLKTLRRKLGDAMYRKSVDDPDVAPFMPGRRFLDWTYRMDTATRELYARMAWDLKHELDEAIRGGTPFSASLHYAGGKRPDEATAVGKAMAIHTAMEMLLDHPDLIVDSAMDYAEGAGKGSKYASVIYSSGALDELTHSPKLKLLMDKLTDADGRPRQQGDHLHPIPMDAVAHRRCYPGPGVGRSGVQRERCRRPTSRRPGPGSCIILTAGCSVHPRGRARY